MLLMHSAEFMATAAETTWQHSGKNLVQYNTALADT